MEAVPQDLEYAGQRFHKFRLDWTGRRQAVYRAVTIRRQSIVSRTISAAKTKNVPRA